MGRRKGRRRPTRREKIAAGKKAAGCRVVATGIKKKGKAEIIRPDFNSISPDTRKMVEKHAKLMGRDPKELFSKVNS